MDERCSKCKSKNIEFPDITNDNWEFLPEYCGFDEIGVKEPYHCNACEYEGYFIYVKKACLVAIV